MRKFVATNHHYFFIVSVFIEQFFAKQKERFVGKQSSSKIIPSST